MASHCCCTVLTHVTCLPRFLHSNVFDIQYSTLVLVFALFVSFRYTHALSSTLLLSIYLFFSISPIIGLLAFSISPNIGLLLYPSIFSRRFSFFTFSTPLCLHVNQKPVFSSRSQSTLPEMHNKSLRPARTPL